MKKLHKMTLTLLFLVVAGGVVTENVVYSAVQPITAEEFLLENFQGEVVLMDFWASWCKPCEKSMPWLAHLDETFGPDGLKVVAVNLDREWQDAVEMAASLPAGILLVHDPEGILAAERNLQGMPSTYLYDRENRLAVAHVGFLPNETDEKEEEIRNLLDGTSQGAGDHLLGDDIAGVQPWERDLLAAPGMAIDSDPMETSLNEHVYFSKEATSGGLGSAGGGCGCN